MEGDTVTLDHLRSVPPLHGVDVDIPAVVREPLAHLVDPFLFAPLVEGPHGIAHEGDPVRLLVAWEAVGPTGTSHTVPARHGVSPR